MKTMYPAQANSPVTELATAINGVQTTITLVDASQVPAPPNLLTIGTDESAETILYTGKSGNDLTGVTRGFQVASNSWAAGTKVARNLTAYDIDAMRENIQSITSETINKIPAKLIGDIPGAYPVGVSVFSLSTAESAAWKAALGHTGTGDTTLIETSKVSGEYAIVQRVVFSNGTGVTAVFERTSYANNQWTGAWTKVVSRSEFDTFKDDTTAQLAETAYLGPVFANYFQGKVYNALGDSLTEENVHKSKIYHDWVRELLNIATVNNYGLSGSTIAKKSESDTTAMCVRYADMDDEADLITVMGGVNDIWFNTPLGTIGDTNPLTFYGAMNTLCKGLIGKYPGKQIMFITPTEQNNPGCTAANITGFTARDFSNAIVAVCSKYSIPVLDSNSLLGIYPLIAANSSLYTTDGLHLNDTGNEKLGKLLSKFILNPTGTGVILKDPNEQAYIDKRITFTGSSIGNYVHFTALVEIDSDFFNGAVVSATLEGVEPKNMGAGSLDGGSLFTDSTGVLSNGAYNGVCSLISNHSQEVTGRSIKFSTPDRTINENVSGSKYLKVPFIVFGSAYPFSFKIADISVYVNGKEKSILKIGTFFNHETYTFK